MTIEIVRTQSALVNKQLVFHFPPQTPTHNHHSIMFPSFCWTMKLDIDNRKFPVEQYHKRDTMWEIARLEFEEEEDKKWFKRNEN